MKWILIVGGVLAGLVAIVVLVGALLPRAHVASRTARFTAPPEAIWGAITDWQAFPRWRSGIKTVRALEGGHGWVESGRQGDMPLAIEVEEPPRKLVTRIAGKLPFGGTWTWDIHPLPDGSGTTVTITEDGEIYNPVFRFVSHLLMDQRGTMTTYLRDLATHLREELRLQD